MSIENRDLKPGTKLVARYKGQEHTAEVVKTEAGIRYRLADGDEHKSPSAAGSAIMGGNACNGWRFWSLEGDAPKREKKPAAKKPAAKGGRKPKSTNSDGLIKRLPDEDGLPAGQAKFFCNACMGSFQAPANVDPIGCPQGHTPESVAV